MREQRTVDVGELGHDDPAEAVVGVIECDASVVKNRDLGVAVTPAPPGIPDRVCDVGWPNAPDTPVALPKRARSPKVHVTDLPASRRLRDQYTTLSRHVIAPSRPVHDTSRRLLARAGRLSVPAEQSDTSDVNSCTSGSAPLPRRATTDETMPFHSLTRRCAPLRVVISFPTDKSGRRAPNEGRVTSSAFVAFRDSALR